MTRSFNYAAPAAVIALLSLRPVHLHAQTTLNDILQRAGNIQLEDDNAPFVPNAFVGSFTMEMRMYEGGAEQKESPLTMKLWSNPEMTLMQTVLPGMKGQEMKMLNDLKGKWQYMLMTDASGKRMAMKSKKKKVVMKDGADSARKAMDITVTNETRTINGYTCRKVIGTCTEGTWTGWVTEELQGPFGDLAKHVRSGNSDLNSRASEVKGFPMEYEWAQADGSAKTTCTIKALTTGPVDASLFSLDGYEVMVIPGM